MHGLNGIHIVGVKEKVIIEMLLIEGLYHSQFLGMKAIIHGIILRLKRMPAFMMRIL